MCPFCLFDTHCSEAFRTTRLSGLMTSASRAILTWCLGYGFVSHSLSFPHSEQDCEDIVTRDKKPVTCRKASAMVIICV